MTTDGPLKRSITIAGHRTSLSLEEEFWSELKRLAAEDDISLASLITSLDKSRGPRNLSSALRVYVLQQLKEAKVPSPLRGEG